VEIAAHQRRVEPWRDAILGVAPDADVYHCKALVALPVVAGAAARARAMARAGAAARTGRVERDGAVERVGTAARAGPPPGAEAAAPTRGRALFAYDLADLHTEAARIARMPRPIRALVRGREARWVRAASLRFAVSDGVAREAARRFHVPEPVVVLNCPPAWHPEEPGPPASDRIREATGIAPGRPIVLYQGGFSVDRGIEELVGALDEPGMRTLDPAVVLLGYGRLRERLLAEAAARPGKLFVVDAVPPGELLAWTASADIGFVGQPPRTLNQRLNLANKLFESVMAGLPVVVAEGTEHCRVTRAEGLGTCCRIEPAAIASAVARLLGASPHERAALRSHVRSVALERYTWERQQRGLVEAFRSLAAETGAE
jgi:glycosyltransferase involved in cell wall biosynthesis